MSQITTARVEDLDLTTNSQAFSMTGAPVPGTLWVRPAGGTWTVEYSPDGGENYYSLAALTGATVYKEVRVNAGFSNIRITSSTGDGGTWGIV